MKSAAAIAAEATIAQAEAMAATGYRSVFILCVCLNVFFSRVVPNASVNSTREVKRAETTIINSDLFMTNLFIY